MSSQIIIAVLSALAVLATQRIFKVSHNVSLTDLEARRRDDDLELWLADEDRRLERRLRQIDEECNGLNLYYSGERMRQRTEARQESLRAYRDERLRAERALGDRVAAESLAERIWRRLSGRPVLELTAPQRMRKLLMRWAESEAYPGGWALVDDGEDPSTRLHRAEENPFLLRVP